MSANCWLYVFTRAEYLCVCVGGCVGVCVCVLCLKKHPFILTSFLSCLQSFFSFWPLSSHSDIFLLILSSFLLCLHLSSYSDIFLLNLSSFFFFLHLSSYSYTFLLFLLSFFSIHTCVSFCNCLRKLSSFLKTKICHDAPYPYPYPCPYPYPYPLRNSCWCLLKLNGIKWN